MFLKKFLLVIFALSPSLALARHIAEIRGQVTSSTCNVTVNGGSGNVTVLLPTVTVSNFAAPNASAGETSFSVEVARCSVPGTLLEVRFIVNRNRPGTSSMLNTEGDGYAKGVDVIMAQEPDDNSQLPQIGNGILKTFITMQGPPNDRFGSRRYYVKYLRWGSPTVTAGKVFTSAQYAILYP